MAEWDIVEVARRSGHTASTLRFYEEKGLIRSHGRRGLRRVYSSDVVERLSMIALGRAAGFSLDELASMIPVGRRPSIDKARLAAKAAEIDGLVRRLRAVRKGLLHAIECDAPDFMACPHFRRVLRAAQRHKLPPAPAVGKAPVRAVHWGGRPDPPPQK
jgi:DNA-binding transcriptional MerR regulator